MLSKIAQMKEEKGLKVHAESTSSLGELAKSTSKLSAALAVKRRLKVNTPIVSPATSRKTNRPQTIEKNSMMEMAYSATLPTGIAAPNFCQALRYSVVTPISSSGYSTPVTQRQHSVPSSPSCPNAPSSLRYISGSRNSPGVQSTRSYDQRYQIPQQQRQSELKRTGSGLERYDPQGYTLPYCLPGSCIGTPQAQRQVRYGGGRKEMPGGFQGNSTFTPQTRRAHTGCICRHVCNGVCKDMKSRLSAPPEHKNSNSSSSNSEASKDSGIQSQDGFSSQDNSRHRGNSVCVEDMAISKCLELKGYSTPQCVSKSGRLRGQRYTSVQPSSTPTTSKTGQFKPSEHAKQTESPVKYRNPMNRSNSKTATVRPSSRLPVSASSQRNSTDLQVSRSGSTSCTSSPATPRASWSTADSSNGSRSPHTVSQSKTSKNNSTASQRISQNNDAMKSHKGAEDRMQRSSNSAASSAYENASLVPPFNVRTVEPNVEDIGRMARKIQEQFKADPQHPDRPIRKSSLPTETNQNIDSSEPTSDHCLRAKTLSPSPPQIQKQKKLIPANKPISSSPSECGTSSCTLAQNSTATSLNNLNNSSRSDETPTPREDSRCRFKQPPVVSVAPIPTSTSKVPRLMVEGTLEELLKTDQPQKPTTQQQYRHLHVPSFDGPARSPGTPQRMMTRPVPENQPRVGGGEDQVYGCLGYSQPPSSPLSHIKLPYATSVPRMQCTAVTTNLNAPPTVCHSQSNSSLCRRLSVNDSQSGMVKSSIYATSNTTPSVSDAFGSHISLSSTSSVFSPQGSDISLNEAAKLKRELNQAHQKVAALTCQLSANTSVVQAFEQSLLSMNNRLQQLTTSSVVKDKEIQEMQRMIERFRCQTSLDFWLMENGRSKNGGKELSQSQEFVKGHLMDVLHSGGLQQAESLSSLLQSPHGSNFQGINKYINEVNQRRGYFPLQLHQQQAFDAIHTSSKKAGWLRSSITRAFRRSKSREVVDRQKVSSTSTQDISAPSQSSGSGGTSYRQSPSSSTNDDSPMNPTSSTGFPLHPPSISQMSVAAADLIKLQHQLADKDLRLTDAQLESLSRFHQLETMQEILVSLQSEVASLKVENEMLHQTVDRCSASGSSELSSVPSNQGSTRRRMLAILGDLFSHETANHKLVPVFLELGHRGHGGPDTTPSNHRRHLSLPQRPQMIPISANQSPNPSTRLMQQQQHACGRAPSEMRDYQGDLTHLHLLGRISIEQTGTPLSLQSVRERVKNLFKLYMSFLDVDDHIGLTCNSLASMLVKCIPAWTPEGVKGGQPTEYLLRANSPEDCSVTIDGGNEISRIIVHLNDNAYADRPAGFSGQGKDRLNPLATSSVAWISLLPCSLLQKMVESLLANKCVIIYGPKGAGKLEFGRILIDSMAKMFPGFWSSQPHVLQYQLQATSNVCNELRQILLNGLEMEGLIILRLPSLTLPDLIRTMDELNFHTHPRKILLLAITDALHFPEAATKLQNCPGIFPFLVDLHSTASYMRRCLKQRFSQYAFQCLEAEPSAQQVRMKSQNPSHMQQELEHLGNVLDWLPEFWLRLVGLKKTINESSDSFPLSPFRLLICPLTLQSSWMWFRELWEAEVQALLHVRASSVPPTNILITPQQRLADVTRWMFATWPWPELPSGINGLPQLQRKEGCLSQMSFATQSMSMLSMTGPKDHPMCNSELVVVPSSVRESARLESSDTLYDSSCSLPAMLTSPNVS